MAQSADKDTVKVTDLKEVEVTAKHQKYSKKDNPAYELMRRIRSSKDMNDPRQLPAYTEDYYTKITLGMDGEDAEVYYKKKKLRFLENYIDTAVHTGKPVLLLSLRESAGTRLHEEASKDIKQIKKGERNLGIDDNIAPENLTKVIEDLLRDIDIYDDDIVVMQQRFVSPIGRLADNFYRYSLNDTVYIDDKPHLELVFAPSSAEMFGFNGRLFVEDHDSTYFIKRVEMRVPRYINLNYVDNIYITQTYSRDSYGKRHVDSDDMSLELTVIPGTPTLFARRLTVNQSPDFYPDMTDNLLSEAKKDVTLENPDEQPWDEWDNLRPVQLSNAENGMGTMMGRLRQIPLFYWSERILKVLVNGYITTGPNSKFDFGPVNTFISYNSIEGVRLRVGGLTTAQLSRHWFGRGYVAYGCKDRKFKYNAELEYSLYPKQYHSREFPINSIRLHYNYELDNIGQHYIYTNADNVFLSLKRHGSNLSVYRREAGATYKLELANNLSVTAELRHRTYEPTPWLPFVDGNGLRRDKYSLSGIMLELRYAPGEKFVQTRGTRYPVNFDAPVFILRQEFVPKGLLSSAFCLNKTELSISKRFWFSAFGYLDAILKGGILWSQVYYPSLLWQNANLSYTIQKESYSLMNPMEFPLDRFASIDLSYFANGLIFNNIPLIKRLKLREVVTFKCLTGRLSSKNDPSKNPSLLSFPADADVQRLHKTPYMELSAGLDNILTCLRLDYVWRLSYRHRPGCPDSGMRISLHFSF